MYVSCHPGVIIFTNLDASGAIAVVKGTAQNRSLVTLELGRNSIGDRVAQAVGHCLGVNETLEGLSLWKNALLSAGAHQISQGLANNQTLQWLCLAGNGVGPDGAKALATIGLANNHTLLWLALGKYC